MTDNIGITARVTIDLSLTGGHIPDRLLTIVEELQDLGVSVAIHGPSPDEVEFALDSLETRLEAARRTFKVSTSEINDLTHRIEEARSINRFLRQRDTVGST